MTKMTATRRYPRVEARYSPELIEQVRQLYAGGMTQVEVADALGLTAMIIRRLMVKHNIPVRRAIKRDQTGANNHMWKGDQVGYAAGHERAAKARGTPQLCEHCGTTTMPCEWASITGDFGDIWDYKRLCRSCHAKYDSIADNYPNHRKPKAARA